MFRNEACAKSRDASEVCRDQPSASVDIAPTWSPHSPGQLRPNPAEIVPNIAGSAKGSPSSTATSTHKSRPHFGRAWQRHSGGESGRLVRHFKRSCPEIRQRWPGMNDIGATSAEFSEASTKFGRCRSTFRRLRQDFAHISPNLANSTAFSLKGDFDASSMR